MATGGPRTHLVCRTGGEARRPVVESEVELTKSGAWHLGAVAV